MGKSPLRLARYVALAAVVALLSPPASRAVTHQVDYHAHGTEYCHRESFNVGACLGGTRRDAIGGHEGLTDAQILQCLECSGKFRGDETCDEIKALNDVEPEAGADAAAINRNESFCESYNLCVEANCPKRCLREQDAWLECLVIELDCDWRCPGSEWLSAGGGRAGPAMYSGAGGRRTWRDRVVAWTAAALAGGALLGGLDL